MGIFDGLKRVFGGELAKSEVKPAEPIRERIEEKEGRYKAVAVTEASIEHPDRNEDAYVIDADRGSMVLGDGAGGHGGGDRISRFVVDEVKKETPRFVMDDQGRVVTDPEKVSQRMDLVIREVAERAAVEAERIFVELKGEYDSLGDKTDPDSVARRQKLERIVVRNKKPATTLITSQMVEQAGKMYAVIKSVGDSGASILRANGKVERLRINSEGMLARRVRARFITQEQADFIEQASSIDELIYFCKQRSIITAAQEDRLNQIKTSEGLIHHRSQAPGQPTLESVVGLSEEARNLFTMFDEYWGYKQLRGVAPIMLGKRFGEFDELVIDTAIVQLFPGDALLLKSDGPEDNLTPAEEQQELGGTGSLTDRISRHIRKAVARSREGWKKHLRSKADDMTEIGMEVPKEFKLPAAAPREVQLPPAPDRGPVPDAPQVPARGVRPLEPAMTAEIIPEVRVREWQQQISDLTDAERNLGLVQQDLVALEKMPIHPRERVMALSQEIADFEAEIERLRPLAEEAQIKLMEAKGHGSLPIVAHQTKGDVVRYLVFGMDQPARVTRINSGGYYLAETIERDGANVQLLKLDASKVQKACLRQAEYLKEQREARRVEAARLQAQAAAKPTASSGTAGPLRTKWEPPKK